MLLELSFEPALKRAHLIIFTRESQLKRSLAEFGSHSKKKLFRLSFCESFSVKVALTERCQKRLILRKFQGFYRLIYLRLNGFFYSIPVR
ncbi:MAG: hypothetical protein ABR69_11855 [OM182 bacterium BACL3 MAG-120507-bin80]|uniref:Uncharacterized protein n=1 Tax=OM182 bacterium BACL3 MAG-120507-bin80 TaxID=1655577 RepID=A0A0R2SHZ8_9GAMM|nr:MAG: hypothetical protein ABR69_11855 [OM182 bacterium BACL3 MAG-120507-bin80]